ncbi:MAG TPA: hypothetical protein DDY98_05995 [Ruminococcaceae bacterium]|nr:hypothetical protein [Oscillospiraceae bacterium]
MRILFQGDSITDGNRYQDEERRWDLNHQIGHSYAFTVSGTLGARYPQANLTFINRGISGNRTQDLLKRWDTDTIAEHPDLLSLLVGVNDANGTPTPPGEFEKNLTELLKRTFEANPHLRVILMAPFMLNVGNYEDENNASVLLVKEYAAIAEQVASRYDAVTLVKLQPVLDRVCALREKKYWLWDGVHPTESGHALLAKLWLDAFEKMFVDSLPTPSGLV